MKKNNHYVAAATALATAMLIQSTATAKPTSIQPNVVSCKLIRTAAQLQAMKNSLAGSYCLANDIDLSSIANFEPIGDDATPFTGHFFGNNRVIRNLRINDSTHLRVGLFGVVQGTIEDVSLVNVNVNSTAPSGNVGGMAGRTEGSSVVRNVGVSGRVRCTGTCVAGGVVGDAEGPVSTSWSSADVTGVVQVGGLVGVNSDVASDSFATGRVVCTAGTCQAGGLIGAGNGTIARSFATGPVSGADHSIVGGLAGANFTGASQSFATGSVSGGNSSTVGGLFGAVFNSGTIVDQCYAVGRVSGGTSATLGGLIASMNSGPVVTNSYWDTDTTGQATSVGGGTGLTTVQLRSAVPAGFAPRVWAISKNLTFPFLNESEIDFTSSLAMLVRANKVFTFLPISQLDLSQYRFNPVHEATASLAAVYTMIARAVGIADNVAQLKNVKIDRYFWHDRRQRTTFTGPVTKHAALGVLKPLAANARLTRANVIGKLDAQRLVILRGTFTKGNGTRTTHWMLGTLYTRGPGRIIGAVMANDPWTGLQVAIDPASKTVMSPANFPLRNFRVNGYQPVLVH